MRSEIALLFLAALVGCSDKSPSGTDSGDTDTQDSDTDSGGDSDTSAEIPVWSQVRIETSNTLTGLFPTSDGNVAVVAEGGKAWLRNSGAWSSIAAETDNEDFNDVWGTGAAASLQLTAVGNVGIVDSYDASTGSWTMEDLGTANLLAVDGPGIANLFAVGWGGIYTNASGAWEYVDAATGRRLNDVYWDGTTGMAVGEDGDYAVYTEGTWVDNAIDARKTLYAVSASGPENIWAVGAEGAMYKWDGSQWKAQEAPTDGSIWDVCVVSDTEVYIVGNNGAAYNFDGTTWTKLPTGVTNNLYGVDSVGDGTVWAIGNRGMVLEYNR